jgi:hypothetical protein
VVCESKQQGLHRDHHDRDPTHQALWSALHHQTICPPAINAGKARLFRAFQRSMACLFSIDPLSLECQFSPIPAM